MTIFITSVVTAITVCVCVCVCTCAFVVCCMCQQCVGVLCVVCVGVIYTIMQSYCTLHYVFHCIYEITSQYEGLKSANIVVAV